MATLNIKNFPDELHAKLKELAKKNGRSLSSEVEFLLAEQMLRRPSHTIADLRGLGKGTWKGVDPHAWVQKERKSWGRS